MKDAPSATARLIAASTVLAARDRKADDHTLAKAADWCERFLSVRFADRVLLRSVRSAFCRRVWRMVERSTHPGIVHHFHRRKEWIERACRDAIANGFDTVIVLGAGFDSLAVRLSIERPDLTFIEVDHPATQAVKAAALSRAEPESSVTLVPFDLSREGVGEVVSGVRNLKGSNVLVIAEGLLMYLSAWEVDRLIGSLRALQALRVRLIFTYMDDPGAGEIGFRPRSVLVRAWLAMKKEPFRWALRASDVESWAHERGFRLLADADCAAIDGHVHDLRGENIAVVERACNTA